MFFRILNSKKVLLPVLLLLCSTLFAQNNNTGAKTAEGGYNMTAVLLSVVAVVLVFVIWGLGQVLVLLGRQLLNKSKEAGKSSSAILTVVFLVMAFSASAQDAGVNAVTAPTNYGGLSANTFYFFVAVLGTEIAAILFLALSIRNLYRELTPAKPAVVKTNALKEWWNNMDKKLFTKAVPVEKESDVLLDHDYDGIKELDNSLPPWWKYGFYITIVVGVIYLAHFHVFASGKNPLQEYNAEMDKAKVEKEAYEAQNKDKIDEANVPMADAAGIAAAKTFFDEKCKACHGGAGEGGAGPNLTDDYWIHKGSLNDIYLSIKNGYADKGMQAWATVYSPKEMSYLASYIKTLHGTNPPNAKQPQGDLYTETAVPVKDSAAVMLVDTAKVRAGKK
jgi:cytochrome c oxidase cbb3-type subunit 3